MSVLLVNGNALAIPLADNSVHCVITSPPYWGLRDYGTATWQGGDPDCDHLMGQVGDTRNKGRNRAASGGTFHDSPKVEPAFIIPYRDTCGKCGAVRVDAQLGLEPTPEAYVANMVAVFREVRRVLRPDGTLFLNLGDSYNGSGGAGGDYNEGGLKDGQPRYPGRKVGTLKPKDLVGIPWMVAFALRADGWWLRSDIIWAKPNPMPESVTDRPTKAHEYLFLLAKSATYYYDADAVREDNSPGGLEHNQRYGLTSRIDPGGNSRADDGNGRLMVMPGNPAGRNRRTVWNIATESYSGAHYATFPRKLVEPCIKAGTSEAGACSKCGAPWERIVDRVAPPYVPPSEIDRFGTGDAGVHRRIGGQYQKWMDANLPQTTGWRPTCAHADLDPIPATILDPFAGSGTTLLVARQLGRNGIGLDLSLPYLREQARERLGLAAWNEWTQGKKNGKAGELEGLPMFEGQL